MLQDSKSSDTAVRDGQETARPLSAGKRRTYPAYEPSGILWLGDIPDGWRTASLRWISRRYTGGTPGRQNPDFWTDGTIPWVNSGTVNQWIITEPSALITELGYRQSSTKWIPAGAIAMALAGQGKTKGMVAQAGIPVCCNQSMAAICPMKGVYPKYLLWWLCSQYPRIRGLAGDAQRDGLNLDVVGSIPCPLPSHDEQRTIAAFLDRETGRIDALIEKKRRQIELLQEKRSALISHAITKGLDPGAPMKNSGIDWMGQIPEHWEAKRLRFLISEPLKYGANESAELDDPTLPRYIRITDIDENGRLREDTFKSLPEDVARPYLLKDGDLLLARSGATVGKSFYYEPSWGRAAYAGYLIRARFNSARMMPRFVNYFTDSQQYWQWLGSSLIQATIQNVSAEKYANLIVPVPPVDEQAEIVSYLDGTWKRLNELLDKVNESIGRLVEYRAALISAAVTGRIDIRREVV